MNKAAGPHGTRWVQSLDRRSSFLSPVDHGKLIFLTLRAEKTLPTITAALLTEGAWSWAGLLDHNGWAMERKTLLCPCASIKVFVKVCTEYLSPDRIHRPFQAPAHHTPNFIFTKGKTWDPAAAPLASWQSPVSVLPLSSRPQPPAQYIFNNHTSVASLHPGQDMITKEGRLHLTPVCSL